MSARDSFSVYLRGLDARDIGYRAIDDGRHVLDITLDVTLYVRPAEDDVAAVTAGLRKLAAAAGEMAAALSGQRLEAEAEAEAGILSAPEPDPLACAETSDGRHTASWYAGGVCVPCGITGPQPRRVPCMRTVWSDGSPGQCGLPVDHEPTGECPGNPHARPALDPEASQS